jgi:hypothetical protein
MELTIPEEVTPFNIKYLSSPYFYCVAW